MNFKRIAGGLARAGFWTGTGIIVFRVGRGIKEFGWELARDPILGLAGLGLVAVGEVVQICTLVNGVCTFSAALDVAGEIKEGLSEKA